MLTIARPPVTPSRVPDAPRTKAAPAPRKHWGLRLTLAVLELFLAATTIWGAIFVVPALPREYLRWGPFSDFTIPALALGILCGGSALAALAAVLMRPRLGALLAVVSGVMMIGFELVEIGVVGFIAVTSPDQPVAWLQVFYIVFGAAVMLLGARLWKAETGAYRLLWPPF
jgi:hypothetical protein